jgi:hypothetical protein
VSAKERTSTGCSDQGALRLKHRRPNEHSAMSAKPATQIVGQTSATHQVAMKAHCRAFLAAASLAPRGNPQAPHMLLLPIGSPAGQAGVRCAESEIPT